MPAKKYERKKNVNAGSQKRTFLKGSSIIKSEIINKKVKYTLENPPAVRFDYKSPLIVLAENNQNKTKNVNKALAAAETKTKKTQKIKTKNKKNKKIILPKYLQKLSLSKPGIFKKRIMAKFKNVPGCTVVGNCVACINTPAVAAFTAAMQEVDNDPIWAELGMNTNFPLFTLYSCTTTACVRSFYPGNPLPSPHLFN